MTQFEIALQQVEAGTLAVPSVSYGGKDVNYFGYQLAVHHMELKLLAKGMRLNRNSKLKPIKDYYGLKGRTAADCLPQFEAIFEKYKNRQNLN